MKELMEKIQYIQNNHVKVGIVESPSDYEFSSYNYYHENIKNYLVDIPE